MAETKRRRRKKKDVPTVKPRTPRPSKQFESPVQDVQDVVVDYKQDPDFDSAKYLKERGWIQQGRNRNGLQNWRDPRQTGEVWKEDVLKVPADGGEGMQTIQQTHVGPCDFVHAEHDAVRMQMKRDQRERKAAEQEDDDFSDDE